MAGLNFFEQIKNVFGSGKAKAKSDGGNSEMKELEDYLKGLASSSNGGITKPILPDAPKYDRMEYTPETDEQLMDKAAGSLSEYENLGKSAIEKEMDALKNKYEEDKSGLAGAKTEKENAAVSAFDSAVRDSDNDSLKRGLARSSIAVNKVGELEKSKAEFLSQINSSYADAVSKLDSEIGGLDLKRDKAMNDFNIGYVVKLTNEINSLKEQREKKKEEALKYNNGITEKEASAEIDKIMKESDLYGESLSNKQKENELLMGSDKVKEALYNQTYQKMAQVLRDVGGEDARQLLRDDPLFKDNLNEYYYYKLYDEFGR